MAEILTWDQRRFQETLNRYLEISKRTFQSIINSKAFFVARQAIWYTPKAEVARVKSGLGQVVSVNRLSTAGKVVKQVKQRKAVLRLGRNDVPLAVLILQKRLAEKGQASPFKGKSRAAGRRLMDKLVKKMLGARLRSIAFIKSGWLPAVGILAPFADRRGQPPLDNAARQIGKPKGTAEPARSAFNPIAKIMNLASARHDQKQALVRYGTVGLQKAIDAETASMNRYIEDRTKPDADEFNRAQRN
jgi:hypothetical protein